jgi:predicted tellurium resistance membrane protein TerC
MELLTDPASWLAFLTLSALEIVLGIDNIIFISVLVGRLPEHQRRKARNFGLLVAMGTRIALLLSIVWLIGLTRPWFTVLENEISGRDLVLIVGGLFLLGKSVLEIHHTLEGAAESHKAKVFSSFMLIIVQIAVIDIVFSLDSVFTAVGLAEPHQVPIMVAAIVLSILVMMLLAGPISDFVEAHPTVKVLALAFLILVGIALVADGLDTHMPKGYLYFAMAFSVSVEMVNLRLRKLLDRRRSEKAG